MTGDYVARSGAANLAPEASYLTLGEASFRDPSAARAAWTEMQAGASKHDTFVFDKTGTRTLFWDASTKNLSTLSADLRTAVEAIGR